MPDALEGFIKEGLIRKGNDPKLNVHRLPIGIAALDDLLGGGIPLGHCTEIYGPESTGKSLIAQYVTAAVQKTDYPVCLYLDLERSYDEPWWRMSGVDTDELLVSSPPTGEKAIDIIKAMCLNEPRLGMIFIDSIAGLIPSPNMEPDRNFDDKSIEQVQPGLQARLVTALYQRITPLLDNRIIMLATNQMRDTIGGYDELGALPGGRAQRHYNHIILKTRRDSWIKDKNQKPIGFYMDVTSRKNKLASIPDGTNVLIPFLASSQIDMLTAFLEHAIKSQAITRKGPYYYWAGKSYMGIDNLREFFNTNPEEMKELENAVQLG